MRSLWRAASRDRGWSYPDDWWTPAVDAVTEAVVSDGDIAERCSRLGRARARAGVGMQETLDDVLAMAGLVYSLQQHPTHLVDERAVPIDVASLLRSAAIGWSEESPFDGAIPQAERPASLPDAGCSPTRTRPRRWGTTHAKLPRPAMGWTGSTPRGMRSSLTSPKAPAARAR